MAHMSDAARILLVDDRPENLLALEAILGSLDQILVRASSGEEALRALLRDDYALILLDAQMPGMDGFETATRIKARERTRDVPIIFLTAVDRDAHFAYRGYAAGAADYISKPFDPWLLRAKVQVFIDLWRAGERLVAQTELLRRQLEERTGQVDVVSELQIRLADVEDAVGSLAAANGDERARERLDRRLRELRRAIDALGG
ncbi:CheY-like chemotaxis protein [Nocardioides thalensis]|uniref:CheY-like chemotaxis protein n=1 Tax=Nocardioides thalensis TaxID=1914755 RepID=A0A853BYX8_9ACTN|nr:response regulator [Nocardioides thalensis]NYJ00379.1 CheY-like chemotaxis protein [Nocardioides thalensis]